MEGGKRGLEWRYTVAALLSSLGSAVLGPYLSLWLKTVGLSFSEIGLVQGVSEIVQLLTDFPTGGFADRYGRVKTCAAGSALFGTGLLMIALSSGLPMVLLGSAMTGFGAALVSGTMIPWLYDSLGDGNRVKDVLSRVKALSGPVRFAGGLSAGYLASLAPNLPVLAAGLLSIASALTAYLLLPDNYGTLKKSYVEVLKEGLHELRHNRAVHFLLAASFLLSFSVRAFFTFWMILLSGRGLPETYMGLLFALMVLSTSGGALIAKKISPTPRALAALTALWGLEILLLGLVEGLAPSILLLFAIEITLGARFPVMAVVRNRFIPSEARSTVNSAMSTMASGFMAAANIFVGALASSFGLEVAYKTAGILALASALPLLLLSEFDQE
ncbi:MFS transporter [Thermococcus celericrescens]|uniref:MFS transporter n=1 Tax=Thermococcus celericrescens TaxID=227598 RepID=A0A100XWL2_9EURY|nr:MFS transporter [Thermococcus celericrescens]KUH32375.1 MFS transporter [Thermococcus celericrescens]